MRIFIISFLTMVCFYCEGVTYYVDTCSTGGGDGTTPDINGPHAAWKNITDINDLAPGDAVLLKRGCTWRKPLIVGASGSPGNPILYGAYGTGPDPVLNGASLITNWAKADGTNIANVYKTYQYNEPNMVFFDGIFGTKIPALSNLNGVNQWFWDSRTLYIYSASDPNMAYTSPGIETTTIWWNGIFCKYSHIIIEDITVKHFKIDGIQIKPNTGNGLTDVIVRRCRCTYNWANGIYSSNNDNQADYSVSNVLIEDCIFDYNREFGIKIYEYSNNISVKNNSVHHNGWIPSSPWGRHGISVRGSTPARGPNEVIIEKNTVYNNYECDQCPSPEGAGIQADDNAKNIIIRYNNIYNNEGQGITLNVANNCKIYGNLIYNNGDGDSSADSGIMLINSHHNSIYNNVIHENRKYGIYVYDTTGRTTDTVIKNNIFSKNAILELRVYPGAQNNFTSNYNLFHHPQNDSFIEWVNGFYSFSQYKTVSGQDFKSIQADPYFIDPNNSNFHLKETSPCIGSGTDMKIQVNYDGKPVGCIYNIGAY